MNIVGEKIALWRSMSDQDGGKVGPKKLNLPKKKLFNDSLPKVTGPKLQPGWPIFYHCSRYDALTVRS